MVEIKICGQKTKVSGCIIINPSTKQWKGLLPSNVGPCQMYGGNIAINTERAWISTEVHLEHTENGQPTGDYYSWSKLYREGLDDTIPESPILYNIWHSRKLGIIEARKEIFAPLYIKSVTTTKSWANLKELYSKARKQIAIRDPSSYDLKGKSLTQALYDHKKPFGFSFLLMMLLTNDPAIRELA